MVTLANVRSMARDRLNEPSARFWTDAELNRWINEGQRDVARRSEVIQTSTSINIVANQNDYTLTSRIIRIFRVEYTDTDGVIYPLEYRNFNNMDSIGYGFVDVSATGRSMYYTLWGVPPSLTITLFPKPDQNITNGLTYYYYSYPADLTVDGDALVLPEGWYDLVIDYVEFSALRKNKDGRWQEAKQLYEQKLDQMKALTRSWSDQPTQFDIYQRRSPFWFPEDEWGY